MRGEQPERVNDVIEEVGQLVETLAHDEGVASLLGIPPDLRAPTAKELASELLPTEGKHRVLSLKPGLSRACLVEGTVDHLTQLKCLVVLLLLSCMTSQCRDEVRSCLLQRDVSCKQAAAPLAADAWTYIKCLVDCTLSSAAAFQAVYGEKANLVAGSGTVPAPLVFLRMALVRTAFTLRRTGTRPATFTPEVTKQVDCLAGGAGGLLQRNDNKLHAFCTLFLCHNHLGARSLSMTLTAGETGEQEDSTGGGRCLYQLREHVDGVMTGRLTVQFCVPGFLGSGIFKLSRDRVDTFLSEVAPPPRKMVSLADLAGGEAVSLSPQERTALDALLRGVRNELRGVKEGGVFSQATDKKDRLKHFQEACTRLCGEDPSARRTSAMAGATLALQELSSLQPPGIPVDKVQAHFARVLTGSNSVSLPDGAVDWRRLLGAFAKSPLFADLWAHRWMESGQLLRQVEDNRLVQEPPLVRPSERERQAGRDAPPGGEAEKDQAAGGSGAAHVAAAPCTWSSLRALVSEDPAAGGPGAAGVTTRACGLRNLTTGADRGGASDAATNKNKRGGRKRKSNQESGASCAEKEQATGGARARKQDDKRQKLAERGAGLSATGRRNAGRGRGRRPGRAAGTGLVEGVESALL